MPGYETYKKARDAAWRFLLVNNINTLPVMLFDLCETNQIRLYRDPSNEYLKADQHGISYVKDNSYHILTNGSDPLNEQRFTIAHELGHIFMEHNMTNNQYGRNYGVRVKPQTSDEYQAERFATNILAPACVLWMAGITKAEDIAEVCRIPYEYAKWRAARIHELDKRNKFGTSQLEVNVINMFAPYVKDFKKKRK